jgi:aminoglycoside/choline kinase family phosphotransferase
METPTITIKQARDGSWSYYEATPRGPRYLGNVATRKEAITIARQEGHLAGDPR